MAEFSWRIAALAGALMIDPSHPGNAAESVQPAHVQSFLEINCFDCHDGHSRKGDLRLDDLSLEIATPHAAKIWGRIVARLETGEMPPPKRERPPQAELDAVLAWSKAGLAAEAGRRRSDGRAHIRRLNRLEYENTVRDLLGVDVALQALLPVDDKAEGFDTTASALSVSPIHIERYMEAADLALQSALQRGARPATQTHRFSYTHQKENAFFAQKAYARMLVRRDGELQFFAEPGVEHPAYLRQFSELTLRQPGHYRVRIAARTLDGRGRQAMFGVRTAGPRQRLGITSLGWFDAPEGEGGVFEVESFFGPGETVIVEPYRLNDLRRQRGLSQYAPGDDPIIARRKVLVNPQAPTGLALGIAWVEVEGPLVNAWPSIGHRRLFGDLPMVKFKELPGTVATPGRLGRLRDSDLLTPVTAQPESDAKRLLSAFLARAFRRPVDATEVAPYLGIVREHLERAECFEAAMLSAYRAVLCSPDFLFRLEQPGPLDDHALAARLSYFLWRTAPDEALRAIADRGELRRPETLRRETERLLDSPRVQAFVTDFLDQWLHLRDFEATMPDKLLFPEFYVQDGGNNFKDDGLLRASMLAETRLFFAELLRQNGDVRQVIDSDFTYLNNRLADYYRLPPVEGVTMRRTNLPPATERGGILTQASVLKVTANGTRTSPILRGVWFLENILDRKPPPPPADAGSIDPDTRGTTTIREQLAKHQASASCASCHRQIDPPGFALEQFDPAGQWRASYRTRDGVEAVTAPRPQPPAAPGEELRGRDILGPPTFLLGAKVDASGRLPDGREFADAREFKRLILEQPEAVARGLAAKLVTFSTGHGIEPGDLLRLDAIVARTKDRGLGLRSLVHEVIQSELFREK